MLIKKTTLKFRIDKTPPAYWLFHFLPPSPTLFSTPHLLILENFASLPMCTVMPASPFIPDFLFSNSCAQSTAVVWSQGKATKLFDVHFSFTSMTFISIYWLQLCDNVSSKLLKNFSKPIFFGNFQLPLGIFQNKFEFWFWFLICIIPSSTRMLKRWKVLLKQNRDTATKKM